MTKTPIKHEIPTALCAAVLSCAFVFGYFFSCASPDGGWSVNLPGWTVVVPLLLLSFVLKFLALYAAFRWADRAVARGGKDAGRAGRGILGKAAAKVASRPFLVPFLVILVGWLPYLVVYFPGTLPWDGARSMNQFITDAPLQNHHPVLMNLLYAGLMSLGRVLWSDNLGLLLIVCFQCIACAAAFAVSIRQLVDMGAPRWCWMGALAFFALVPIWGMNAHVAYKDTLFSGVFCWFVLCVVRLVAMLRSRGAAKGHEDAGSVPPGACGAKSWIGDDVARGPLAMLLLASLAMCFTRNNGVYVVAPVLAVLAFVAFFSCRRKSAPMRLPALLAAVFGCVVLVYLLAFKAIYPAMGIAAQENKEMLSVPFQQTARCLLEHPDDVAPWEREAIDAVLPYDKLASAYLPDLSDPVKEGVRFADGNVPSDELGAYLKAWFSMGLRHPVTYLKAFMANTYAYFYPFKVVGPEISRPVFQTEQIGLPINKDFDVHYLTPDGLRANVSSFIDVQTRMPVLELVFSPAIYVIVLLLMTTYCFRTRNWWALAVLLPSWLLLLTVLAGPLNGHLRYVLPIASALPLCFGSVVVFSDSRKRGTASHDGR